MAALMAHVQGWTPAILLIICSFTVFHANGVDYTRDPSATGSIITRAVIAKLDHMFGNRELFPDGTDIWRLTHSTFMRILAFVESQDGIEMNQNIHTYQGIWRVHTGHFLDAFDHFSQNYSIKMDVNDAFNNESTWDFLHNATNLPLYSALGATLVLIHSGELPDRPRLCSLSMFPTARSSIDDMANFWHFCYKRGDTEDQILALTEVKRFKDIAESIQDECSVRSDIAFVLDGSGSIGRPNWEKVKNYVGNVSSTTSSEGNERVAVITFSSNERTRININFTANQTELEKRISALQFPDGGTNTAGGLCHLLDLDWKENVLRIVIVLTDGRSNIPSPICGDLDEAVWHVQMNLTGAIRFVVAVGDNVFFRELQQIATSHDLIYNLSSLQDTSELDRVIDQQSYQICHIASSFMVPGQNASLELQNSETLRLVYDFQDELGLTVRICTSNGKVVLYGSFTISNPNRALHDFALDAFISQNTSCQDVFVQKNFIGSTRGQSKRQLPTSSVQVYIAIEGVAERSTFTIKTTVGDTTEYTVSCDDDPCGNNTECLAAGFNYLCQCIPGHIFEPDLFNCIDFNECLFLASNCGQFATCTNTPGSYECTCTDGYVNNGVECIINQNSDLRLIVTSVSAVAGALVITVLILTAAFIVAYKVKVKKGNSKNNYKSTLPAGMTKNIAKFDGTSVDILY